MQKRILLICFLLLSSLLITTIQITPIKAFDENWMYKVRRAIRLGQDYLDRLYKEFNNAQWGALAEYPTSNPLGIYVHETGSKHTAGDGDMDGEGTNMPSSWYPYWDKIMGSYTFEWVEPNTRDYLYIADFGFEETDRYDPITGDNTGNADCNEPCITVEFENEQLILNPSIEFRKYLDPFVDNDQPWDWNSGASYGAIARMGYLNPSHTGYYCLVLQPNGGACHWASNTFSVKANQKYYFAFAFYGQILSEGDAFFAVIWLDNNHDSIRADVNFIPPGAYYWTYTHYDFTSPPNSKYAYIGVWLSNRGYLYLDTFYGIENINNLYTNPSKNMRCSWQVYNYLGTRTVDIYFDGELVCPNVNSTYVGPNGPKPRPYFTKVKQTFQSMRTAVRHGVPNANLYYKYSADKIYWQNRSDKINSIVTYYNITPTADPPSYDLYHPMWKVTSTYPTYWYCSRWWRGDPYPGGWEYNILYDYKYGDTDWLYHPYGVTPFRDVNHHVYRSKVLLGPSLWAEGWDIGDYPFCSAGQWKWPGTLAMVAMHYLEKYNDPNYQFDYWGKGIATPAGLILGPNYGPTPAGSILQYWTEGGIWYPPELWLQGVYTAPTQALCLAALTVLGYGYGYAAAQEKADALANILINIQWGNPDATGQPEGYGFHETYGWVYRPDNTGGFYCNYKYGSMFKATTAWPLVDYLSDFLCGMPKETYAFIPTNQESQFCVRALQIYDWYVFKKNGATNSGMAPSLLIAEDVTGGGSVDVGDIVRVNQQFGKQRGDPDFDPLCDFDLNNKINVADQVMVNQNFGRH